MEHLSQEILKQRLDEAGNKVKVGKTYSHFKNPDKFYKVIQLAIAEATGEICVIYQAQYGEHLSFVRPLPSWLDTVSLNGQEIPRFKEAAL